MPVFSIVIQATVTKKMRIEAATAEEAEREAHETFSVLCDTHPDDEAYTQNTYSIEPVKE
jgi:hypothetical protein